MALIEESVCAGVRRHRRASARQRLQIARRVINID
jgi:hypothetical protein